MQIIELSELQFKNYSKIHSAKNIYQTVEYANMMIKCGYNRVFLGLIDDNDNVMAATLILEANKNKVKSGLVPGGFLIDYNDKELLTIFTNCLKEYLAQKKYVYIRLNPLVDFRIYDKHNKLLVDNNNFITNMTTLGYNYLGSNYYLGKYKAILRTRKTITDTYQKFNGNTKRNISKSSLKSINIYKGNKNDIELFYNLLNNKDKKDIAYYQELFDYYNDENNSFEIYFAKIDPKTYVNNYRYLLKEESIKNSNLNELIKNVNIKKTNNLINKKMQSDKKVISYNNEIIKATKIYTNYPEGIVLGTVGIIKNKKQISFLFEGHLDNTKEFYSSYLIKWEIIKKYLNDGYKIFDLGNVDLNDKGLCLSKLGFNANIYEYPGQFDLVINKIVYKMITMIKIK